MTGQAQTRPETTIRTTTSRGYTISYEDTGAGTPVVLITGFTGSAQQMREDGYVDRLAVSHRVLNVDPLGHGRSATPHAWEAYRFPDVAADIVAVLDAAGLERAALWGYSRGAVLACMAAIEYPERVAALILGGGGDLGTTPSAPPPPYVAALAQGDWAALWAGMGVTLPERQRRQFEASDPRAMAAVWVGECNSGYVMDLSRVAAPTLVYCGGQDDPETHRRIAEALGAEVQIVGAGDHPQTVRDVDGVMPLAVAHLAAVGL